MNSYRKNLLASIFKSGNVDEGQIESLADDARLDKIPEANLLQVFSLIKTNRRNNFTNPLTVAELLEAWDGLQSGVQNELF